jgi:myo-inositol-1-phosphate synthase
MGGAGGPPKPRGLGNKAASVVVSNSAAASAEEPKETEGELDMLDGELRVVRNGNVYEFDALEEKVGCFLGRKTAEGTIDVDAEEMDVEEEKAPESDLDVATAAVLKAATAVKAENASLKAELASLKAELASLKAGLAKLCG